MRSETVKQVGSTEAFEELLDILGSLRETGACRVNGRELFAGDEVTLEIEADADEDHGEIEFEITWPGMGASERPRVSILMGNLSELLVMQRGADVLGELGIDSELCVLPAHRTTSELVDYLASAGERGAEVFIAEAAGAGNLPTAVASEVTSPVIGLPIAAPIPLGSDSALDVARRLVNPPVATVASGAAEHAGLLAARVLSLKYPVLGERLIEYRERRALAACGTSVPTASVGVHGRTEPAFSPR